ncbi:MAG TPA: hypothetical protein VI299_11085 [Polyangiales bacterium]
MSPEARLLLRLGLLLWLGAALATVWELLALQPPDSPLHLGVLAGPIGQLRNFAFAHGAAVVLLAAVWMRLYDTHSGRWVAWLLALGAVTHTLALGYAAAHGLLAVQLFDPRLDARLVLYTRAFAHTLTCVGLLAVCARSLRQSN